MKFGSYIKTVSLWLQLNRRNGSTPWKLFFLDLPKHALRKSYAGAASFLNRKLLFSVNKNSIIRFHDAHHASASGHYYIIVMPNVLHLLLPCLALLQGIPIVFILNGASAQDARYLLETYPHIPQFKLRTLPRSSMAHVLVLDLLFAANEGNFGIIDHDLYIFHSEALQNIQLDDKTALAYIFAHKNEKTGLLFPTTHFLYFNTLVIKSLMHRYKLSHLSNPGVPRNMKSQIASLGIGLDNLPKKWVSFYDTSHLVMAMAHYEGLEFSSLGLANGRSMHIGHTTYSLTGLTYSWLYARLLELHCNEEIRARYWKKLIHFPDKDALLDHYLKHHGSMQELASLNKAVNHIAAHLADTPT